MSIGSAFGQRRKKKSLTTYPLTIACIDAYDMQPEEGVLLYIDGNLTATSDSAGRLNVRLRRSSGAVNISLIHQDSLRTNVFMKEHLSDLVNNYHVLLYPNSTYEAEIWEQEDALYGTVSREAVSSDSTVFPILPSNDSIAHFIGGRSTMYDYINANLQTEMLPEISTTVYLRFVVEKDGSLSHILTQNEVDADVQREAIRLVRNMPKWNPSRIDGQAIRALIQLPITIRF